MFLTILEKTYDVLLESAPYILFGVFAAGMLKVLFDSFNIGGWVSAPRLSSVARSALAGVPMPLCSCSVLPVAMELRRNGASKGATASFLVSTPQTGVDSFFLTIGLINPVFAVARLIAAFFTGFFAGAVQTYYEQRHPGETAIQPLKKSCCGSHKQSPSAKSSVLRRLWDGQFYAFSDLLPSLSKYYMIGFIATGIALYFIPDGYLEGFVGGGALGMLAVCALGVIVYICASGATPLAAVLLAKGMSPGTALVFLMAGPVTSLASMVAVKAMLGFHGLLLYLFSIVASTMALGLSLDTVIRIFNLDFVTQGAVLEHHHVSPASHLMAIVVGLIILYYSAKPYALKIYNMAAGRKTPAPASCCHLSSEKSP